MTRNNEIDDAKEKISLKPPIMELNARNKLFEY